MSGLQTCMLSIGNIYRYSISNIKFRLDDKIVTKCLFINKQIL